VDLHEALRQLREAVEVYRMHRQANADAETLAGAADDIADWAGTVDHVLDRDGVIPADLRNPNRWVGYGPDLSPGQRPADS
jgi:hypothetical protein